MEIQTGSAQRVSRPSARHSRSQFPLVLIFLHPCCCLPGRMGWPQQKSSLDKIRQPHLLLSECPVGRSSNGRTADSGSAYRGSNPCLPAILFSIICPWINSLHPAEPTKRYNRAPSETSTDWGQFWAQLRTSENATSRAGHGPADCANRQPQGLRALGLALASAQQPFQLCEGLPVQ